MENEIIYVNFDYKGKTTLIQTDKSEKVKDIIPLFCFQNELEIEDLDFFYQNNPIDFEKKFSELNIDENNTITINVSKMEKENLLGNYNFEEINQKKYNGKKYDEITIIYNLIHSQGNGVKIFGNGFVRNNKGKCVIIKDDEKGNEVEYELQDYFYIKDEKDRLKIKLRGIKNITNWSNIFEFCISLISVEECQCLSDAKVENMSCMFYGCTSLNSINGLSNINTSNVLFMDWMFYKCSSLTDLKSLANWNTSNVKDMSNIFFGCSSLNFIPDIQNWDTSKVTSLYNCFG